MTNLSLLARIAWGERSFAIPTNATAQEQAEFDDLVRGLGRLAAFGYTGVLRRHRTDDVGGLHWRAIEVLEPGITSAGVEALRRAGIRMPGSSSEQELR